MTKHIFISYAKKDTKPLAEALFNALNAVDGLSAWMDSSLEADESWAAQIQGHIDRADYMIVLLSPDVNRPAAQRRSFVLNEIDYAQQEPNPKPILPVLVQRTKMPVQIAGVQYIDLTAAPNDPAPIVERVCGRFGVESPKQREVREAAAHKAEADRKAKEEQERIHAAQRESKSNAKEEKARRKQAASSTLHESQPEPITSNAVSQRKAPPYNRYFIGGMVGILVVVLVVGGGSLILSSISNNGSPNVTPTLLRLPTATGTISPTSTSIATSSGSTLPPTWTATADAASSSSGDAELDAALSHAYMFTGTNTDWEPFFWAFDGVEMALVPVGCFMMGSEDGQIDEQPVHQQCFTKPFWIDRTEVTNEQFTRLEGVALREGNSTEGNRPRENISWQEAYNFCALRGTRLPTEREWEYAARGSASWIYPWGDIWSENNVDSDQTADVGSSPDNASWVGVLDMSGNVWEWTNSLYKPYPYNLVDGREVYDNSADIRVLRGGAFNDVAFVLRMSYRGGAVLGNASYNFGFRCARDVE